MRVVFTKLLLSAACWFALFCMARGEAEATEAWIPEPGDFDPTPIHHVWQGPDGEVYAGGGGEEKNLLRWKDSGWEILAPLPGFISFGFTAKNGTILFLNRRDLSGRPWNIEGLWSLRPGSDSPEEVEGFAAEDFSANTHSVHVHAAEDREGRIFLTNDSPVNDSPAIYVVEEGRFRKWRTIEVPEPPPRDDSRTIPWGSLHPTRLTDGRIVITGYGHPNYRLFRGYAVIDGSDFSKHELPDFDIDDFCRNRLWFVRPDPQGPIFRLSSPRHLIQLDVDAGEFKDLGGLPATETGAFFRFWHREGDTTWAIFQRQIRIDGESEYDQIQLWERRADGDWKTLGDWMDTRIYRNVDITWSHRSGVRDQYPFLIHGSSVWFGTAELGIARVNRDSGETRHLNWRHGFPIKNADTLFFLPDGRIWAGRPNNSNHSIAFDPAEIRSKAQPDNRILSVPPWSEGGQRPSTQTSDGTVYDLNVVLYNDAHRIRLNRWDGQSWDTLVLKNLIGSHLLLRDRDDRLWVVRTGSHQDDTPKAVIVDGTRMKPLMSGELQDLFATYAREGKDPGFHSNSVPRHGRFFPYFSPHGQIIYRDPNHFYFYDGESWTRLLQSDISAEYPDDPIRNRPAYLEECGHIAVRIGRTTYKWTVGGEWSATEDNSKRLETGRPLREFPAGRGHHRSAVESFGVSPESRIWDLGEDRFWIHTEDGRAYFTYKEWKVPVVPEGGASPIPLIPDIGAHYTHPEGRHLLTTGRGWLIFPELEPGIPPEVTVVKTDYDSRVLKVSKADQVKAWRWRFDDGEWSEPGRKEMLEAYNLLPGHYRVQLQALSRGLVWMDPQAVEIEIDYDLSLVLKNAFEDLRSDDRDKRGRAIERLALDPEAAATLLESVDDTELSDRDRWWIEAARQKMRRQPETSNRIRLSERSSVEAAPTP